MSTEYFYIAQTANSQIKFVPDAELQNLSFAVFVQVWPPESAGSCGIWCSTRRNHMPGKYCCSRCSWQSHYCWRWKTSRRYSGPSMRTHSGIYQPYFQRFCYTGEIDLFAAIIFRHYVRCWHSSITTFVCNSPAVWPYFSFLIDDTRHLRRQKLEAEIIDDKEKLI